MQEICNFFEVKRKSEMASYQGDYFVVEDCATFDPALSAFELVCMLYQTEKLLQYVNANYRRVYAHFEKCIQEGNGVMSTNLLKSSLKLQTYTQEFVKEAGSVQAFLDIHGAAYNVRNVETAEVPEATEIPDMDELPEMDELPDNGIQGSFSFTEEPVVRPELRPETEAEQVNENAFSFNSEETPDSPENGIELDSAPEFEFREEPVQEDFTTKEPEELVQEDQTQPEDSSPNFSFNFEEGNSEPEESEVEEEEKSEENKEEEPFWKRQPDLAQETESEGVAEALGTTIPVPDGVELPGITTENGKAYIPYNELADVLKSLVQATKDLETKEVETTRLLTANDKQEVIGYIDEFSPSLIKDFMLDYIDSAESDIDFVRITKMLDHFCEFVHKHSQKIREVGKHE